VYATLIVCGAALSLGSGKRLEKEEQTTRTQGRPDRARTKKKKKRPQKGPKEEDRKRSQRRGREKKGYACKFNTKGFSSAQACKFLFNVSNTRKKKMRVIKQSL
jgi:hypothetical protein